MENVRDPVLDFGQRKNSSLAYKKIRGHKWVADFSYSVIDRG